MPPGDESPVRRAKKLDTWPGRVTQNIGQQVRHWRHMRKMTTQVLSDTTEALGHRVPRSVITNIEHDRRDFISVAELLILAAALSVPPVMLIAPIGLTEEIEPLPNVDLSPWRTRGWLMGALVPKYQRFDLEQWNEATIPIKLFDKHRLLVRAYQEAVLRLHELEDERMEIYPGRAWPEDELNERRRFRNLLLRQVVTYLEQIRSHRREMMALDVVPPVLPPDVEADLANPNIGT